jgi:hypothetical protein
MQLRRPPAFERAHGDATCNTKIATKTCKAKQPAGRVADADNPASRKQSSVDRYLAGNSLSNQPRPERASVI